MTKKIAAAILLALASATVSAENAAQNPPERQHRGMERVISELSLTDAQSEQFRSVLKGQHEKMKALHEETTEKLKSILTPDQLGKFEMMRHADRQRFHGQEDSQAHKKASP